MDRFQLDGVGIFKVKMQNLKPLSDSDWPDSITEMKSGFAGNLNVYRTMAHHPDLLRAWETLREHIVNQTALGSQLSEVVILRTGHRLGSNYEWAQHIDRARKRGLKDKRIASIAGPLADMDPDDILLCCAVDELIDENRISNGSAAAVIAQFGKTALFDLIATVGFYATLGWIVLTCDVPLDEDVKEALRKRPLEP